VLNLLLDLICTAEHVVNVGKVVGTWEEAIGLAAGGIALLEVGLLTEVAHLKGVSHVVLNNTNVASEKTYLVVNLGSDHTPRL
jgi:hypothetical protein